MAPAKQPISAVVDAACADLGFVRAAQEASVLDAINRCERFLSQQGSMLYLTRRTTIQCATADSDTAAPNDYDFGKEATIVDPDGKRLTYMPPDTFDSIGGVPGGNVSTRIGQPNAWTFAFVGASPAAMVVFAPANTTGSAITYTFQYQRYVEPLLNTSGSFSLLPIGYEMTLLLDSTIWLMKDKLHWPISQRFEDRLDTQMAAFFKSQMVTKPGAGTMDDIQINARALRGAR